MTIVPTGNTRRGTMGMPAPIKADYLTDPRLALAQQMMQQGSSTAPVGSGMEALARALQGGLAGYQAGQVRQEYQQMGDEYQKALTEALGGGDLRQAVPAMMQSENPYVQNLGMELVPKLMGSEAPSAVREFEYYSQLDPAAREQFLNVKRATPWLDLGGQMVRPSPMGGSTPAATIDKTQTPQQVRDSNANMMAERNAALAALRESAQTRSKIDELLVNKEGLNRITGIASIIPNRPGGKAADAQADLDTLKARSAFGGLQEMRASSPTGGALGAIAVQELMMLKDAEASLQNAQSEPEFRKALEEYKTAQMVADKAILNAFKTRYGIDLEAELASPDAGGGDQLSRDAANLTGDSAQGAIPEQPQAPATDPLQAARDAIARGADPAAVRKRLQEAGYDPSALGN